MPRWTIPLFYTAASIVVALVLPSVERHIPHPFEMTVSVNAALAVLSAIASGTMALTAIVFTIAFVVVQFSAVAYSPRVALQFARQPMLFHALGVFAATFTYALATAAWVDRDGDGHVPPLSWILACALVLVSLIAFAILVQKVEELQITTTLRTIGDRGREVIAALAARQGAAPDLAQQAHSLPPATQRLVYEGPPLTLQALDIAALVALARGAGAVIEMASAVGDTVADRSLLLRVRGARAAIDEAALRRAVRLGQERTYEQDPKYALRLLVDVAIKALSPAINDPTTAVQAIDQIEDLMRRLARRPLDSGHVADADGALRLVLLMPDWQDYLALAFDETRVFGMGSVQVIRRMRWCLRGLADELGDDLRAEAVARYLGHLDRAIARSALDEEDRGAAAGEDAQGLGLTRARPPRGPPG